MTAEQATGPGFYIAHHRWLDSDFGPDALYKVGHTGNLARRLTDDAYITCFSSSWKYIATFGLPTKGEAESLEAAVLHCQQAWRVDGRELVRAPAAALVALADELCRRFGLRPTRVISATMIEASPESGATPTELTGGRSLVGAAPESEDAPPVNSVGVAPDSEEASKEVTAPSLWRAKRHLVGDLVRAPPPAAAPPPTTEQDYLDEILGLDFSELANAAKTKEEMKAAVVDAKATIESSEADSDEVELARELEVADAVLAPADDAAAPAAVEMREYQREAHAGCVRELRATGRAILQMACRCGKTLVAYNAMADFAGEGAVLYLVPSLLLLHQTAQKLTGYGFAGPMLLVGSDPRSVRLAAGKTAAMTTDPSRIRDFLACGSAGRLVISTYQSSGLVPAGAFALTVFDEAHRVCGGDAPRPFNCVVAAPRAGARLFMTATPALEPTAISMKDRGIFGGVAYRYYMRSGIDAGYVNDFRLELVVAPPPGRSAGAATATLVSQILTAAGMADKMLVFCRDIAHARALCAAARAAAGPVGAAAGAAPLLKCFEAHSGVRDRIPEVYDALAKPGRVVVFSVRMFQEGVEVPSLNAVFFAAPRHSPRDIIQSVCRPLNRLTGKPQSVVFLPVTCDPAAAPDDPQNLTRFETIVPFADALLAEDPRFYEHLLDPAGAPYPFGVVGAGPAFGADPARREAYLAAARRAVRYGASRAARPTDRLVNVGAVPWELVYGQISWTVHALRRYPKGTDTWKVHGQQVSFHRFYKWAATEFAKWRAGEPTALEPHQTSDLLKLPKWEPYGVEGPYIWSESMAFLERWLAEHDGVPPMVEINRGGFVGLSASPLERLSGVLTTVNQQDGRAAKGRAPGSGYKLSAAHRADLARVCGPWGLRWRKERGPDGEPVENGPPTFIQEAYTRFKAHYAAHKKVPSDFLRQYFPGYPKKHEKQEELDVLEAGLAGPRLGAVRREAAKAAGVARAPATAAARRRAAIRRGPQN